MTRHVLVALLLLVGCERADRTDKVTAHYPWTKAPHAGDVLVTSHHSQGTLHVGTVERHSELQIESTTTIVDVADEDVTKFRVDVTRDDHTMDGDAFGTPVIGSFELVGDPPTSVRRLDGEITDEERQRLVEYRSDCSAAERRRLAERLFRAGETVVILDPQAKCMGFQKAVPNSLSLTLTSYDGATTEFAFAFDRLEEDRARRVHVAGTMRLTNTQKIRNEDVTLTQGTHSAAWHIESVMRFTPGPAPTAATP